MHTDEDLLRDSLNGRPEAFSQLIERHQRKVYGLLWRLCGPIPDKDDLYQQVWMRAWASRAGFRHESRFATWLYAITLNMVREWRRRQRPTLPLDRAPEAAAPGPGALEQLLGRERRAHLDSQLRRLSGPEQELLALRYQQGLDYDAIAAVAGGTAVGARVKVFRALARLRKSMKDPRP